MITSNVKSLTESDLRAKCPAAFAERPSPKVSANYRFVPTLAIVERLEANGFLPVSVNSPMMKMNGKTGKLVPSSFGPHLISFEPKTAELHPPILGEARVQVRLFNSHDRSRRLQLRAGLLRLVCLNGLTVGVQEDSLHLTHLDSHMLHVDEQIDRVLSQAEKLPALMQRMQARELTDRETTNFAESAMELRFGDRKLWRVSLEQILTPRRDADKGNDLWRTFNRVQENLTKGGLHNARTPMPTMPLTRPKQTFDFNVGLWSLADSYLN